jgi:predicted DNA-binding transcriptional regulator AlpA
MDQQEQERLLPLQQMCRRYGISARTIDRWLENGILPQPVWMGKVRFWRLADLQQIERERIGVKADPPRKRGRKPAIQAEKHINP